MSWILIQMNFISGSDCSEHWHFTFKSYTLPDSTTIFTICRANSELKITHLVQECSIYEGESLCNTNFVWNFNCSIRAEIWSHCYFWKIILCRILITWSQVVITRFSISCPMAQGMLILTKLSSKFHMICFEKYQTLYARQMKICRYVKLWAMVQHNGTNIENVDYVVENT